MYVEFYFSPQTNHYSTHGEFFSYSRDLKPWNPTRDREIHYWKSLIQNLITTSNKSVLSLDLSDWLWKEWGIYLEYHNPEFPEHVTGLYVDDGFLAMIYLKYPLR